MKKIYFLLTTLDDISISESHAKSFANRCLDFIPGSAIMGAFAQFALRNGEDLDSDKWFGLLQNNSTCFSNCLPVDLSKDYVDIALPVPSSLHYAKLSNKLIEDYVNASCANKSGEDGDQQLKQEREGYILSKSSNEAGSLNKLGVKTNSVTKTAINSKSQTADEGKLFSFSYIRQNQNFCGYIQVDDKDVELVKNFVKSETLRIGKSRNNEFGRVSITLLDETTSSSKGDLHKDFAEIKDSNNNHLLYLWCLSDCQFYDLDLCLPTTLPRFDNLWLDNKSLKATYDPEKSFLRTKKVRLFNRKRGGLDGEKQLISKGSIICFKLNQALTKDQMKAMEENSIGLDRQLGFGRVIVNPGWIASYKLDSKVTFFDSIKLPVKADKSAVCKANSSTSKLYEWLKSNSGEEKLNATTAAVKILEEIKKIYRISREYNFINAKESWGLVQVNGVVLRQLYVSIQCLAHKHSINLRLIRRFVSI